MLPLHVESLNTRDHKGSEECGVVWLSMAMIWVFMGILVTMCMTLRRGREEQGHSLPLCSLKTKSARIASSEHFWEFSECPHL